MLRPVRSRACLTPCAFRPPGPTAPMNEAQLRERVAALERQVEEKHKELLVLRETVPAKVRRASPMCSTPLRCQPHLHTS